MDGWMHKYTGMGREIHWQQALIWLKSERKASSVAPSASYRQ